MSRVSRRNQLTGDGGETELASCDSADLLSDTVQSINTIRPLAC
jgi:hypothetical protein